MREELQFEQLRLRPEIELLNLLNARISMEEFMTLTAEDILIVNRSLIKIVEEI